MANVSAVRPVVQAVATSEQQTAGNSARNGSADHNGASHAPAASAVTPRPVAQASGAERLSAELAGQNTAPDRAQDRVDAAKRAYMMAVRAAGMNPLDNPVP
ncbi:hypothetical protein [Pseudogemmobacter sonorensis]|uniref:hypothetical protein n=1 Tax=Pseudogemmobacter sonorensis TaxID=2989681 RepID=UPI00369369A2